MPDVEVRMLERAVAQGDLHQALALARHLRRMQGRRRIREGTVVHGPLLALALRAALEAKGLREVEVLRQARIDPRHFERWIRALRLLMRGEARSFVWVQRWCGLLSVDPATLTVVAQPVSS